MLRNARRLDVARSWLRAREAYASVVQERDQLRRELAWTKQSLDEVRAAARELQAASLARLKAEQELAAVVREREIARARAAERHPAAQLQ